ncbi:MAG: HAMP domain-containing sensor histidine kinase [Planctomycetota bacterium]|nr:HAMP domain-containing sensor histidine kinase [Planctomycetota bacterium]
MRSQGAKKAAILLSLALAPSCVMAWLGLRSIGIEENEARQTALTKAQKAATQIDSFLEEQIAFRGARFAEELRGAPENSDLESLARLGQRFARNHPDYHLAFGVDLNGALVIPEASPYNQRPPPTAREIEIVRNARDLARASEKEAGGQSFAQSILLGAAGDIDHYDLEASIEYELAQLALRSGLPELALDHYRRLFIEYPDARRNDRLVYNRRQTLPPFALTVWPAFADLLQRVDGPELPPLSPLANLAENLATNRWKLPGAIRDTRWNLVQSDLKDLAAKWLKAEKIEQGQRVQKEHLRIIALKRSHDVIHSRTAAELGRRLEEFVVKAKTGVSAELLQPSTIEISTLEGPHLYIALPLILGESTAMLAVELNLESLVRNLRSKLPNLASPYEAHVSLFENGQVLARFPDRESSEDSEAGLPSLSSIHSWNIVSEPQDKDAPAIEARKRWFYYGILVFSCLMAALIGSVVTVKSIDRQVMLAKMRTKLVRNVSHELRTPVASIGMLAEILQDGGLPKNREKDYYDRIARESQRLGMLVEKVLSLSQIEQGARQLELQDEAIGPLTELLVENFRLSEEGRAVAIEFDDQSAQACALADAEALDQVLNNLLSNAVKYGEGKKVEVSVGVQGKNITVSVRDYGRGISAEARAKLFSPFFRERPEDNSATGIGIGLTIVKQLVHLMKGRIDIDPKISSNGTRFIVSLPRRRVQAPTPLENS